MSSSPSTDKADLITFVFGNPSLPGPAGQPRGDLVIAEPPYTQSGSGQQIKMLGEHVLQLRFMPHVPLRRHRRPRPTTAPTRSSRTCRSCATPRFDEFEGQIGWYLGYDGPGCVTLGRDGNNVTIAFARP